MPSEMDHGRARIFRTAEQSANSNMRWFALGSLPLLVSAAILIPCAASATVFVVTSCIGASVGLWGLYHLLKHPTLVRFSNVLSVSLLLGYGLGTAIRALTALISAGRFDPTDSPFGFSYRQADISYSLVFVTLASALLLTVGVIEKPAFPTRALRNPPSPRPKVLLLALAALVAAAYALGELGYMGTTVSLTRNITPLGALSGFVAPVLLPLTVLCLTQERSRVWRAILVVLLCASALALIPLGRRVLLYSIVLALFAFGISGKRLPIRRSHRWLLIGIGVPFLIGFTSLGFYAFFALRLTEDALGPGYSFPQRVTYAVRVLAYGATRVAPEFGENVGSRPFILSYLADLYAAQNDHSPLWGQEAAFAVQNAVPSILFPNKAALLPAAPEEFAHPALGMPTFDGANTIVTAGLDDFGAAGTLAYPLALVLLCVFIRRVIAGRLPPFIYDFVIFRMLYQLLYVEQGLDGMVTVAFRDLILATLLLFLLWKLFGLRLSPQPMPHSQLQAGAYGNSRSIA